MKKEKEPTAGVLALAAFAWTLSLHAFGEQVLLTADSATEGSSSQDEEEDETFVARWCEDRQASDHPQISDALSEQDRFVEELLNSHYKAVASERDRYAEKRTEFLADKDTLRKHLISEFEDFLSDQRKKGDPRDIMEFIEEMILLLEDEHGIPVALNPLEKPKKRKGKRTVIVDESKSKIDTVVFGGHEYTLVPGISNWLDAKRWCEERGGYLACIETREELEFIGREMIGLGQPATPRLDAMQPHRYNYWVGASDSKSEGSWRWLSGPPVDMNLFHRNGIPGQPSEFAWGEHHGGIVVYRHPEREEPEIGLISWNLASNSGAICEWGRTRLPKPWSVLTEEEVDELLVPFWKDLEKVESLFQSARKKMETGVKYRRPGESFQRSVAKRREDLGEHLENLRRGSVKDGRYLYTAKLKDLASGLELGGLDRAAPPFAQERSKRDYSVVGRAFGKSYLVINEQMTFHDAEDVCRELGGQLPSPKSNLEMDLLRYVMETEGSISETWLAIARHPSGPRSGWPSPETALGADSPKWMEDLIENVGDPHQSDMYAFGLVLPLVGNEDATEDEDPAPPDPYVLNSQLRRPFICLVEGF